MSKLNQSKASLGGLGIEVTAPAAPRSNKFWIAVLAAYAVSAGAFALGAPIVVEKAKGHAAYAANKGDQLLATDAKQAISRYQVARLLDRNNLSYSQKLSDAYLAQGMVSRALDALRDARGQEERIALLLLKLDRPDEAAQILKARTEKASSGEIYVLLTKAHLETEAYDDARKAAEKAAEYASTKEQGIVLGVIADKLSGDKDISHIAVSSQEAARQIAAVKAGQIPLAQVLYDLGLLRRSQRVLEAVSPQNAGSYSLRAQIKLSQQPTSQVNLLEAADLLRKAIEISPQNLSFHRQLKDVYTALSNQQAANQEAELIQQLESGAI